MSDVMLVLHDSRQSIHRQVPRGDARRLIAALSADPETLDELGQAMERFHVSWFAGHSFEGWNLGEPERGIAGETCVIDLASRLIAGAATGMNLAHCGAVDYHDGNCETDIAVKYHISGQWLIQRRLERWEEAARPRRARYAAGPRRDVRLELYERFYEHAVEQCLRHARRSRKDPVAAIHRDWILTPRDALGDRSPRDVLFSNQLHVDLDLHHRAVQWARTGRCPPGLAESTAAYRFAPIGVHEWVFHYAFARFVLAECWSSVRQRPDLRPKEEVERLQRETRTWFHTPQREAEYLTPHQVIHSERRRIPLAVTTREATVDHDGPLCHTPAEHAAPVFLHFDGSMMDDEFAFSRYLTRVEWDEARRLEARYRASATDADEAKGKEIWQFAGGNEPDEGPLDIELSLFRIGARLAEMILHLRSDKRTASMVDVFQRHYTNLRETVHSRSCELLEPTVARFCQLLDDVAAKQPQLAVKCAELQEKLRSFGERVIDIAG